MPMHDWTKVVPGTYHAFHYRWIAAIADALNSGGLPPDYFALPEQRVGGPEPDVLTLSRPSRHTSADRTGSGVATELPPPKARFVVESDVANYARRANRIAVRHEEGDVVAIIEIMSPGNKSGRSAFQTFVGKLVEYLYRGIHVLIVDPFPPSRRDPQGVHKAIWDEFEDNEFVLPADKPLTLASYDARDGVVAYVDPIAVGDPLPSMPLFLAPRLHVPCPLEATYQTAWAVFPAAVKEHFDGPAS